jgi:hypothetical protein
MCLATRLFFIEAAKQQRQKIIRISLGRRKLGEEMEPTTQLGSTITDVGV